MTELILNQIFRVVLLIIFAPSAPHGQTAKDLFAVHYSHGTLRVDYCGALMVAGKRAVGVEADRVVFERTADYRTTPDKAWGPPIWEFEAKGG